MSFSTTYSLVLHRYLRAPYRLHTKVFQSPPNPRATFLFIHGIGNTLHAWDEVINDMPDDVCLIGIDLLGFGQSPKPTAIVYDAKTQARSVTATIMKLRLQQKPTVVGHSLGALVGIQIARTIPKLIDHLVLCSPPIYKPSHTATRGLQPPDEILREIYHYADMHPDELLRASNRIVKLGLANSSFNLNATNMPSYLAALEASIINQDSFAQAEKLRIKTKIFYGRFDPVVIGRNIRELAAVNGHISVTRLPTGHEIIGPYVTKLVSFLTESII